MQLLRRRAEIDGFVLIHPPVSVCLDRTTSVVSDGQLGLRSQLWETRVVGAAVVKGRVLHDTPITLLVQFLPRLVPVVFVTTSL